MIKNKWIFKIILFIIILTMLFGSILTSYANDQSWDEYIAEGLYKNKLKKLLSTNESIKLNNNKLLQNKKLADSMEPWEINAISDAYLVDINDDNVKELLLVLVQGSMRNYSFRIYEKNSDCYVLLDEQEGYMSPVIYNNETHFIEIKTDFDTKFLSQVIEYRFEGSLFKQKVVYDIKRYYDVSGISKFKEIINNNYLNSLDNYPASKSNIMKTDGPNNDHHLSLVIDDKKNSNLFKFNIYLQYTSVGYAPTKWIIESKDEFTEQFKGIGQIFTNNDDLICFGYKFYKDKFENIFMLKISYDFYNKLDNVKIEDLVLQLYKFNQDSIEKVDSIIIHPKIVVQKRDT